LARAGLRRVDLAGQQLVVGALYAAHRHALAYVVAAQARADLSGQIDDLPRIAWRIGIRNVVAGRLQRRIRRRQPAGADRKDSGGHKTSPCRCEYDRQPAPKLERTVHPVPAIDEAVRMTRASFSA